MSASAKEPRWERRKQDRPQELLAAALELFVERGYAATRLEDVATRAGVSKGTLYLYFDGKESLFKSVVRTNVLPRLPSPASQVWRSRRQIREGLEEFLGVDGGRCRRD